ncbi:hypothetical protein MNBD_ACTINO02-1977 [hydrothermal vent metagenome]|uniref:Peptidase inhibitor family I36 n=1 Tax=hydrothermal vent metagenome TaxID=652676 RepID=A0A3B0SSP6_9ZZZZ
MTETIATRAAAHLRQPVRAVIAVILLATALTIVQQTPAEAGATNCDIGSGKVCLYKNSSYSTGGIYRYGGSDPDYGNGFWLPDTQYLHCWVNCDLNDSVSSIKNRGNFMNTKHYKDKDYEGDFWYIGRNKEFDFWGNSLNNELSSHKWVW